MSDHGEASGLQQPPEFVPLRDVALACFMFNSLTSYNKSLTTFKKATNGELDVSLPRHPGALLKWLNDWGCRHLSIDQHGVASASILQWYQYTGREIAAVRKPLWLFGDAELVQAADAYSILAEMPGAKRGESVVRIGSTAASKVLFALRPESLAPWDDKMRKRFGFGGAAKGYLEFLKLVRQRRSLVPQCEKNGFHITDLPAQLGRDSNTTVVALLNEHMWVTVSAGVDLPARETLGLWAKW